MNLICGKDFGFKFLNVFKVDLASSGNSAHIPLIPRVGYEYGEMTTERELDFGALKACV